MIDSTSAAVPRPRASALRAGSLLSAGMLALPILVIGAAAITGDFSVWRHLVGTVLGDYVGNSLALMLGVGAGVLLLGIPTAWLTTACDFPGRGLFAWALLLPLAVPGYIIAYTYTGLLDFAGPVQTAIRSWSGLGYGEYWFFEVRSLSGAIAMLALVLYPYVYLLARAAFLEQSVSTLEVSRTLGYGVPRAFFRLAIPLARPAIVTGLSLALMETLADYGTVQFFGVATFTTGIFRTFYGFGDAAAAAQLSLSLLTFIAILLFVERRSRREARYHTAGEHASRARRIPLRGARAGLAAVVCALPLLLGFALPASMLAYWSLVKAEPLGAAFGALVWNSFALAFLAALIAVGLALVLAYARRIQRNRLVGLSVAIAGMGYAMPGTIVAVGIIVPLAWLDHALIGIADSWLGAELGLVFSGTLFALLYAYTVRFLAVSLGAVQSGLEKVRPSLDEAGRSLGHGPMKVLRRIHVPLMRSSALTAMLIVFVDTLKELPATLILRPFNFNTLAVRAYELASDERLVDAAPASLTIVVVGLAPVILLSRSIAKGRAGADPVLRPVSPAL